MKTAIALLKGLAVLLAFGALFVSAGLMTMHILTCRVHVERGCR